MASPEMGDDPFHQFQDTCGGLIDPNLTYNPDDSDSGTEHNQYPEYGPRLPTGFASTPADVQERMHALLQHWNPLRGEERTTIMFGRWVEFLIEYGLKYTPEESLRACVKRGLECVRGTLS